MLERRSYEQIDDHKWKPILKYMLAPLKECPFYDHVGVQN